MHSPPSPANSLHDFFLCPFRKVPTYGKESANSAWHDSFDNLNRETDCGCSILSANFVVFRKGMVTAERFRGADYSSIFVET